MGNFNSKKSKSGRRKSDVPDYPRNSRIMKTTRQRVYSQATYDNTQIRRLRDELETHPHIFLLDNVLMAIMFFKNFDKEQQKLISPRRNTLPRELDAGKLREERFECIVPDSIFENVNRNIRFCCSHGPKKEQSDLLIPQRLYVVNDTVEILESNNAPQYSAIDKPSIQVQMILANADNLAANDKKNQFQHDGFVKLKCVDQIHQNHPEISVQEKNEETQMQPGPSTKNDDFEEIYEYSTITAFNTPKPLDVVEKGRRDTFPESCFVYKNQKKEMQVDSEDDDEEEIDPQKPPTEEDLYEKVLYLSSQGFMEFFEKDLFPNTLSPALGFKYTEVRLAGSIPGKIFCIRKHEAKDEPFYCEIIPAVGIEWPAEHTFEFDRRYERPKIWDEIRKKEYQWPTRSMISEIRGLKCVLIPRGFMPKRGANMDFSVEWEIDFPRAERFLDSRMSHPQLKTFLILITLYKTYIQPATKNSGLLVEHFRNFMYWECEADPINWPEHRLGKKLIKLVKSLHDKLATSEMPNYFIKRKNTFKNVPNPNLKYAQKVLHDFQQAPVVYLLGAVRNLKYTNEQFFPKFDVQGLYQILIKDSMKALQELQVVNMRRGPPINVQSMRRASISESTKKLKTVQNVQGDKKYKKESAWRMRQEKAQRAKIVEERKQEKLKNLSQQRKGSVDSIDLEAQFDDKFNMIKYREILIFFIKHFIEIAKRCRKYMGNYNQALLYLKQAYYLAKILEEYSSLEEDAEEYLTQIREDEDVCKQKLATQQDDQDYELPPSTPVRNSVQINNWEYVQQVKSNHINLSNLNSSFHNSAPSQSFAKNPVQRHQSNLKNRTNKYENNRNSSESMDKRSVEFAETIESQ